MSLTQNLNLGDSHSWLDQAADRRCGEAAAMVCSVRGVMLCCTEQCCTLA